MAAMHFEFVSPENVLFSGEVDQVDLPGAEGDMGILAGHAPLVTTLRPGIVTIFRGSAREPVVVTGGFAEVGPGGLTVLADRAVARADFDLATLAALRYARSLRPTTLRGVHFVIDSAQADKLRQAWLRANTGVVLEFIDCPDRRLARAAAELVDAEAALPGVGVTAILPRRSYSPLLGRLLHDRTADKMAGVVSRIPHAAATIQKRRMIFVSDHPCSSK